MLEATARTSANKLSVGRAGAPRVGSAVVEDETTEGLESVAFRGFSPDGGCMDHTDPPPCRYDLHRARLVLRMAHTAGQTPTLGPATAGRCDGPVRGQLVVRRRPLRAGSALLFEVSALMVAAWTIPTPSVPIRPPTGPL